MSEVENSAVQKEDSGQKVYEVGYLLVPTIAGEDVPKAYGDIKELVTGTFHGHIISDEMPKMLNLAYTMVKVIANVRHKFNTAYFGWIKFSMEPEDVLKLKKSLDQDKSIIRFLLLKTVKENTIATKRFMPREAKKPFVVKKSEGDKILTPVEKEKIDKEIDALVSL